MHSKKLLKLVTTLICLVMTIGAFAQNVTVSGNVKDSDGQAAIGAGVIVKGTSFGTVTDVDGNYSIVCKMGDVLVFNYLGFKDSEMKVDRTQIDVTLEEDASVLDEVVVLGYGISQKKQDLSGAVSVLKGTEKIKMRTNNGTTGMLQGQIPGVTVQQNSGSPGGDFSMVIRGKNSPNGQSILWIVDGIPGGPIPNTNEIASLVVLKDAASAALYGAQSGAGGVIVVTTKQAQASNGVRVEYDGQVSFANPVNLLHGLSAKELIDMRTQSTKNAGMSEYLAGYSQEFKDYILTDRTDWADAITRTALSHNHNLAFSFGNQVAKNRLVLSYKNSEGTLLNTFSRGVNVNYKGDFDINRYVKVMENMNWGTGRSRGIGWGSETSGILVNAIYAPSFAPTWGENGEFSSWFPTKWADQTGLLGDCYNPLRLLLGDDNWNRDQTFTTHTTLVIHDIIPGLKFASRFSYSLGHGYGKNFHYWRYEVTGRQESSSSLSDSLSESASVSDNWSTENTLTYDRTFGKHSISAMAATTASKSPATGSYSLSLSANGFDEDDPNYHYVNFANNVPTPSDGVGGVDTNVALVARIGYSWADRYFLTASWRRDYAGRLVYEFNHGDFPAITAAWKISSEPFFNSDLFNLLKVRASWGRVGNINSIGWNYAQTSLSIGNNTNERPQYGITNAGTWGVHVWNENAKNLRLTWETSQQANIGLDVAMLDNRLNFTIDAYDKRTLNLIQTQTTNFPAYVGRSTPQVNEGKILNRGVEIEAGWSDRIGRDFNYYVRGNGSYNHNEILETIHNADGEWATWGGGGSYRNIPYAYRSHVGGPLDEFYLIKCQGIFQSWEDIYDHQKNGKLIQPNAQPGDLKFEDFNGDGQIDDGDRQYVGNSAPNITYALSAGLSWKNLSVDMMLQGVAMAQVYYPAQTMVNCDTEGNFSRSQDIKNAWGWLKTTDATVPRLSRSDPNGNFTRPSTYFLEDGSYLRLKSLTISYDLTNIARKWTHLNERSSTITAYATGENLLTLTRYSGMDPECGGYDTLVYPVPRTFTFGVKIAY